MWYCKLLTGIRFMDMPVNVNRSMMLTWLRAGREFSSMAFCHGIPNSPPCTLGVHSALCWHVLNTDNPGTCRFYQNLPTAPQWQGIYFCMPCWASCANWAFGCGWMQTPSVICIHLKPTGQPTSSSLCKLTKMKYSLQLQIGQLLWAYE